MDKYNRVQQAITAIEAEMKRCGLWSSQSLAVEAYDFRAAFGADTMAFSQWLQFVFVPRVRQIIEQRAEFPTTSMVAARAVREYDGQEHASKLLVLLTEFDRLFDDG